MVLVGSERFCLEKRCGFWRRYFTMDTFESRVPKFLVSSEARKLPVHIASMSAEKMKPRITFQATPTNRFQKANSVESLQSGFSDNVKRRVLKTTHALDTVNESACVSKVRVKLAMPPSVKKSKRPGWDIKGRIQDMEAVNLNLMDKAELLSNRILALEKDKRQLDQDAKVKSVLSQEATTAIEELQKKLCEVKERSDLTLRELDSKIQLLQSQHDAVLNENISLKAELASLKPCYSSLNASMPALKIQLGTTKILLSEALDKSTEDEKVIEELTLKNQTLKLTLQNEENTTQKLQYTHQRLLNAREKH